VNRRRFFETLGVSVVPHHVEYEEISAFHVRDWQRSPEFQQQRCAEHASRGYEAIEDQVDMADVLLFAVRVDEDIIKVSHTKVVEVVTKHLIYV
jgi:hypothetical protein